MLELEWDDELASVAQRLADQCQERSHCHLSFKLGNNFSLVIHLSI
jgi:hypothetical protein